MNRDSKEPIIVLLIPFRLGGLKRPREVIRTRKCFAGPEADGAAGSVPRATLLASFLPRARRTAGAQQPDTAPRVGLRQMRSRRRGLPSPARQEWRAGIWRQGSAAVPLN